MEKQRKPTTKRSGGVTTTALEKTSEHEIAALAYQLWQARDRPDGTPDDDWFRAEETLKSRTRAT
jgi:hypothetical protein